MPSFRRHHGKQRSLGTLNRGGLALRPQQPRRVPRSIEFSRSADWTRDCEVVQFIGGK